MIKKFFTTILISSALLFTGLFIPVGAQAAPNLNFNPTTKEATKDQNFEIDIQVLSSDTEIYGVDAVVLYPADKVGFVKVDKGTFFAEGTVLAAENQQGRIEIHGFLPSIFSSKSGTGTLAKITFSTKVDSGTGQLTFACTQDGNDTKITAKDGTKIYPCSTLNTANLTFKGTGGTGGDTTGGATSTPAPALSCGNVCDTNSNRCPGDAQYCVDYIGDTQPQICGRQPDVRFGAQCSQPANPTPTPTQRPKAGGTKPKATPTPTLAPVEPLQAASVTDYDPIAFNTTYTPESPTPFPTTAPGAGANLGSLAKKVGVGGAVILLILIILFAIRELLKKGPNNPPTPPTNMPSGGVYPEPQQPRYP